MKWLFVTLFCLFPFFSHADALVKPTNNLGLVGFWSFNEGTSTKAHDFSGQGNTGTLTNLAAPASATSGWTASGKLDNAVIFDGSNDYIQVASPTSYDFNNTTFTITGWFNTSLSATQYMVAKGAGGTSIGGYYVAMNGGSLRAATKDSSGGGFTSSDRTTSSSNLSDGRWHFFSVVYTTSTSVAGNNTISIYIDGVLDQGSLSQSGSVYGGTNADALSFGARLVPSAPGGYYTGKLDEVRVFSRGLSTTEITALYKSGAAKFATPQLASGLSTGLLGYWSMDGKDMLNGVVLDRSGNGNNGVPLNISSSTFYTSGKVGQAFNFDASDDYVKIGTGSVGNIGTGDVTMAAWIKAVNAVGFGPIIGKQLSAGNATYFLGEGWLDNTGATISAKNIGCVFYAGGTFATNGQSFRTTNNIVDGNWHHVACTRSGATVIIYVDGVAVPMTTVNDPGAAVNPDTAGTLNIGTTHSVGSNFNGKIDEARIYTRALSAAEIAQLYRTTSGSMSGTVTPTGSLASGLVGYWNFDGKTIVNGVVRDQSTGGNNGNPINIASSTFYAQGKIGQGLNFDGVNDYISMGDVLNFTTDYHLSMSLWFKSTSGSGQWVMAGKFNQSSPYQGYEMYIDNGRVGFDMSRDCTPVACLAMTTTSTYNDNKWHHAVFTNDGTGTIAGSRIYIDGTSVSLNTVQNSLSGSISASGINFEIGARSGSSIPFPGSLDDVRLWNRTLTASEAKQLYLMGK